MHVWQILALAHISQQTSILTTDTGI